MTYQRYDGADRVVSIAHVRRSGDWNFLVAGQAIARAPGGVIQGIDTFRSGVYEVASGQFTGIPAVAQAFEYDGNARLTRERRTKNGATIDTRYEYDAVGNRKVKTVAAPAGTQSALYFYDAADRLVEERTTLASGDGRIVYYEWDGNGNLAGKSEPGRATLYRFDPQNRLIDIRMGASVAQAQAATPSISYAYDAQGNRVRKRAADERGYLIDASYAFPQLAAETWSTGRSYYVRGLDVVRQTIEGGPLLVHLFPLHGHLGTSMGAVDANGEAIEEVDVDAFGNLDQSVGLRQGHVYAGEYWDQDAQLLYLRARWYDPKVGRFISADPFEGTQTDPRSLNRYVYVHGDPVHGGDPSGRETTMMGLSIGMNVSVVSASLAVAGVAAASFLYPYAADAVSTTVWDLLVYNRISHQVPQAAVDAAVNSEARHKHRTDKPNEAHHTVPMYLCGNDSQEKPLITFAQHQGIHAGLSAVLLFIELAGENAAQTLGIPVSRWRKPAILEVGRNGFGRRGIASAIGAFYTAYGSAFGTPRPISVVFPVESELFVGGHRHPLCY